MWPPTDAHRSGSPDVRLWHPHADSILYHRSNVEAPAWEDSLGSFDATEDTSSWLPFLNRDDSPGAAWGKVCFGEDAEGCGGASASSRDAPPHSSLLFSSLCGLQPHVQPGRGDIPADFRAPPMLFLAPSFKAIPYLLRGISYDLCSLSRRAFLAISKRPPRSLAAVCWSAFEGPVHSPGFESLRPWPRRHIDALLLVVSPDDRTDLERQVQRWQEGRAGADRSNVPNNRDGQRERTETTAHGSTRRGTAMALILYQDPRQSDTALYRRVLEHLRDPHLRRFRAMVAYVRWEGLSILADAIEKFLANGGRVDTIFGVDNGVTTPDALLYAHYLQRRFTRYRLAGVFEWPYSNSIFHPKLFQFDFQDRCIAIVGSANLTGGGIFRNHELCIEFTAQPGQPLFRDLRHLWRVYTKDVAPITPSLIRRLAKNARLSSERAPAEPAGRGATPWKKLKVRTPPKRRKPLFEKILTTSDAATKHEVLAEADSLSEKPRRLYLQILHETGGGQQVQLPVATLGVFFGVGKGQSKRVQFQFADKVTDVHLTHFGNNTHRVRLRPLRAVSRPAIVVFSRSAADRYRCTIVPKQSYSNVLSTKCPEQTRRGSRKWGLEG